MDVSVQFNGWSGWLTDCPRNQAPLEAAESVKALRTAQGAAASDFPGRTGTKVISLCIGEGFIGEERGLLASGYSNNDSVAPFSISC